MESLSCSRHLIPTITQSDALTHSHRFSLIPFHVSRKFGVRVRRCRFLPSSKKSSFQDFQDYTKPRRLLPTTELKLFTDESPEKIISFLQSDGSQSLYKVLLRTSSIYGSGLSDMNAGLLICIIDENGDSILQRIPSILSQDHIIHFQRASTDEFIFRGHKLGRIQAMWISLESGKWRLAGTSLTVISACDNQVEEYSESQSPYHSISYDFEVEDVLLGEGNDMPMAEFRPSLVTEYSGADPFSFADANVKTAELLAEKGITNEESMREYADLKYSLLLYDAIFIFAGTSISSITASENTALAFLTGGIGGFLYLLLLQKSVDELPAPELVSMNRKSNFSRLFGGLKGPLLVLAFAFGVAILAMKRNTVDFETAVTPRDILVGMMGFLACKLSVVLSAFKPISMSTKDNV